MPDILLLVQRLRWLRTLHGLTQGQFAEKAGMSYKFYQQIESGRKKQVWLETIDRITAGFGLETRELLAPTPPASLKSALSRGSDRVSKPHPPLDAWSVAEERSSTYEAKRRKGGRPPRR